MKIPETNETFLNPKYQKISSIPRLLKVEIRMKVNLHHKRTIPSKARITKVLGDKIFSQVTVKSPKAMTERVLIIARVLSQCPQKIY